MRRRLVKEKPTGADRLPEVVHPTAAVDERPMSLSAPPTTLPKPLFSAAALNNNAENKR